MKIALVTMPFAHINYPSLALGILKSKLINHNIHVDCFYTNLEYATHIGLSNYQKLSPDSMDCFASNWCFSRILFGNCLDRHTSHLIEHMASYGIKAVELLNIRNECERWIKKLAHREWYKYDVIGFTATAPEIYAVLALGKLIKQILPNKILVYGGYAFHEEAAIEYFNKMPWIDYIVIGEGDESFLSLLQTIESNDAKEMPDGIIHRHNNKLHYVPRQHMIDMNINETPEYDDYFKFLATAQTDLQQYVQDNIFIPLEISRGCYYGNKQCCLFCSDVENAKSQYKPRSPHNALDYIQKSCDKYPDKEIMFVDSIMPKNFVQDIFKVWSQTNCDKSPLWIQTKPWLNRNDISVLAKAGVFEIQFGIEGLHQKLLQILKKGQTVAQSIACMKWCKLYDINCAWTVMFRIPGDDTKWYYEEIKVFEKILHLDPPRTITPVIITKKTPYWNQKSQFKNLRPLSLYRCIYPDDYDLEKMAWLYNYDDEDYQNDSQLFQFGLGTAPCHKKLHDEVLKWRKIHCHKKLELRGNKIHDSRHNETKTIHLTDIEKKILCFCDGPRSKTDVTRRYDYNDVSNLLQQSLLLYSEPHFISLVIIPDEEMIYSESQFSNIAILSDIT